MKNEAEIHRMSDAECRAELKRLCAVGFRPATGCHFSERFLDDASVIVEYEYTKAQEQTRTDPFFPANVDIVGVYINGQMIDPSCIKESTVERWKDEILEDLEYE